MLSVKIIEPSTRSLAVLRVFLLLNLFPLSNKIGYDSITVIELYCLYQVV